LVTFVVELVEFIAELVPFVVELVTVEVEFVVLVVVLVSFPVELVPFVVELVELLTVTFAVELVALDVLLTIGTSYCKCTPAIWMPELSPFEVFGILKLIGTTPTGKVTKY
jgi:hypothetical protein